MASLEWVWRQVCERRPEDRCEIKEMAEERKQTGAGMLPRRQCIRCEAEKEQAKDRSCSLASSEKWRRVKRKTLRQKRQI